MALLKKVKGSTLMETMVATVLLVVIFMVASLIMNSLAKSQANSNTMALDNRVDKLIYLGRYNQLKLPYTEKMDKYIISLGMIENNNESFNVAITNTIDNTVIKNLEVRYEVY